MEPQTFKKVISLGQQEVKGVPMLVEQLLTLELSREAERARRMEMDRAAGVNPNCVCTSVFRRLHLCRRDGDVLHLSQSDGVRGHSQIWGEKSR